MTASTDQELLVEFARSESEEAFATLVTRHINLVYSAALRSTGNPHHAQAITQAVFIILARKAAKLSPRVVLSGWLYQTTRLTSANFMRGELRRQRREQEAFMQSNLNEPDLATWEQIAPLLDEAMGRLSETDRNAVVLRYFENKTAAEIADALRTTEAAAHKRVNRALGKLRKFFSKRGVTLSAALIAGAVSANSVQAAPAGLAATVATAAAKGSAVGGSILALVKGALKIMAWTKTKTAIVAGAFLSLAVGTTSVVVLSKRTEPRLLSEPIPDPNGYDDLIKAAAMISEANVDYSQASLAQLRTSTAANAEALDLARTGLSRECRVPLQYSQTYVSTHLSDLSKVKSLAHAFMAEGKLAEEENRPNAAAKSYLDVVRLSVASTRGGVLIDQLVGTACEALGTSNLQRLVSQLDRESCREAAQVLEGLDTQRQPWTEIIQQEEAWSRRTFTGIGYTFARLTQRKSTKRAYQKGEQKFHAQELTTRQLMVALAARAYALDHGHSPASMADLVPDYLGAVPAESNTGEDPSAVTE